MNSNTTTESSSFPSRGRSCQKERRVGLAAGWEDIWTSVPSATDRTHADIRHPRLRTMKRLLFTLVALLLVAFVVLIPAMLWGENLDDEGPVDEPTSITSYVAVFDVDDEGDM